LFNRMGGERTLDASLMSGSIVDLPAARSGVPASAIW